ncbi:MAG: sterol desaturase family protein [Bryobacteraceae bacterium]
MVVEQLNTVVIGGVLVAVAFVMLAWKERRRPLRRATDSKVRWQVCNFSVGGLGAAARRRLFTMWSRRFGDYLAGLVCFSGPKPAAALVLMDYTFYVWHVLLHRVPVLWRFHSVHHVDPDLDASTALRFHFGELRTPKASAVISSAPRATSPNL